MKLRNKVTGEIAEVEGGVFKLKIGVLEQHLQSLEKLVDEWEDYEEPKESYYIDCDGEIYEPVRLSCTDLDNMTSIGNYFETREEAEKVVEKLKAWKRLKDAGFRITRWDNSIGDDYYKTGQIVISLDNNPMFDEYNDIEPFKRDLDLLFGGEEK